MKRSRDLEDLCIELSQITDNLCNYAYGLSEKQTTTDEIQSLLFSACNHIDRVAEDMKRLDTAEISEPQTMTETITTTKTLYL